LLQALKATSITAIRQMPAMHTKSCGRAAFPAQNIILMMQDDVANSRENPLKGQLFNKPGDNVADVYDGCKVDYRGSIVTAKLFLSVITGEESGVPDGGKVLKSGPNDRVFLNFVDHGGVGIVAFPNGPLLHASELSMALRTMQKKNMFKELLFYMEACESGSMFPGLTANGRIFAVTASNAKESSWGYYCPSNDTVNGTDCPYNGMPCLFDIDSDPCEYTDLRESEPDVYDFMYSLLLQYNASQSLPTHHAAVHRLRKVRHRGGEL